MVIHKCDFCNKQIKDTKHNVTIWYGLHSKEFCDNCGKKMLSKQGQKNIIPPRT
jgi:hypothetical protein